MIVLSLYLSFNVWNSSFCVEKLVKKFEVKWTCHFWVMTFALSEHDPTTRRLWWPNRNRVN